MLRVTATPGYDESFAGDAPASGDTREHESDPAASPEQPPAGTDESAAPDSGGGESVFDSQDSLRLDSGVDPETMSGSGFESDYELDSRIERLREEQKRLEKQAESLEKKAGQLEERARESLE